jgi:hypothetical protein
MSNFEIPNWVKLLEEIVEEAKSSKRKIPRQTPLRD